MTQALANFAKIANLTEQQAYTLAVTVRRNMKHGLTMGQAADSYMKSTQQMLTYAKMDQ